MPDENEQTANPGSDKTLSNAKTAPGDKDVGTTVSKPEVAQANPTTEGVAKTATNPKDAPGTGPGDKDVGAIGIVFLAFYLIAAILLCFYGLIALWPGPSPSGQPPPGKTAATPTPIPSATSPSVNATQTSSAASPSVSTPTPTPSATSSSVSPTQTSPAASPSVSIPTRTPSAALSSVSPTQTSSAASPPVSTPTAIPEATRSPIAIFGRQFEIWDEVRLLLIVILAGALGSLVHTVRSVYWYVGNRKLKWSWLAKYILQPFAGSALAVIFYVVVRGGFFSPQTTFANTSPFGFAALAAMVGLFSEQAVLKLKTVAETVLERPAPGANASPQDEDSEGSPDDTTKTETHSAPPPAK